MATSGLKKVLNSVGLDIRRTRSIALGSDAAHTIRRLCGKRQLTIADIGANIGDETLRLIRSFAGSTIHCFEPIESTFETLRQRVLPHRTIHLHRTALGSVSGEVCMTNEPGSAINQIVARPPDQTDVATIPISTLDDFMRASSVRQFDFVKIDTEGHDLEVLKGGERALASGAIKVIQAEVTFSSSNHLQAQFPEVLEYLAAFGYRYIGTPHTKCLGDRPARVSWADVLFASDQVLQSQGTWPHDWE